MNVRYIPDIEEWIVDSLIYTYRISIVQGKYIVEIIIQSDKELKFCDEYTTLGDALEVILHMEEEELKKLKNEKE